MKSNILITALVVAALFACKNKQITPGLPAFNHNVKEAVKPAKDFSNISFASTKDLSCGMPLTAGLQDTAQYKGKVYGFCSKECKEDFLKNAKTYVKDKK